MATDIKKIINSLLEFYDFGNQVIISVGAGGGQFIEYARPSRKVIAIDKDDEALKMLEENLKTAQLSDKFTLIHSDFLQVEQKGNVVMFEFCLHEMKSPKAAIEHALLMAPDVLVCDHWLDSQWAYVVDEQEKVASSWQAIQSYALKRFQRYETIQSFKDYDEVYQKVKVQGAHAISRISQYKDRKDFTIPMTYAFALIQ
jgi:tRNA A58 N-methylase Trm61